MKVSPFQIIFSDGILGVCKSHSYRLILFYCPQGRSTGTEASTVIHTPYKVYETDFFQSEFHVIKILSR